MMDDADSVKRLLAESYEEGYADGEQAGYRRGVKEASAQCGLTVFNTLCRQIADRVRRGDYMDGDTNIVIAMRVVRDIYKPITPDWPKDDPA